MADHDLIVIGGGAAGLGAARAAAREGRRVLLVEAARPGGDCTFYGCVPSKALLESARRIHAAQTGGAYGFTATVAVDFAGVMRGVRDLVAQVSADESQAQLEEEGIRVAIAKAKFIDSEALDIGGKRLTADRFVVATGATAFVPLIPGLAGVPHLTNRTIFDLHELPEHLLILGGGPIGIELAQAFRRLGAAVTVVEGQPSILPREEPETSAVMAGVLLREGVCVKTGVRVERASPGPTLHLAGGEVVRGSHLLVAVGRRANTQGLNLAAAGVAIEHERIATDATLRTSSKRIFAAGDCTSPLQLTHVGDEQGRLAAKNAFASRRVRFDWRVIPWVTFTDPEIGRVGLTEAEAFTIHGERARVAYLPMTEVDRARCARQTDGFVKLIAAPRPLLGDLGGGEIVGMTAVAHAGGELVAEAALAMRTRSFAGRVVQTVHAYPTWSMAVRLAASQWFGTFGGRTARAARATPSGSVAAKPREVGS